MGELRRLCCGLSKSMRTMLSVCLLILVVVFVFACMGVEIIATSERLTQNEDTMEIVRDHFSSLPMAILTLTAIIVENALAHGREDVEESQRQMRKVVKRIVPEIEEVFDK